MCCVCESCISFGDDFSHLFSKVMITILRPKINLIFVFFSHYKQALNLSNLNYLFHNFVECIFLCLIIKGSLELAKTNYCNNTSYRPIQIKVLVLLFLVEKITHTSRVEIHPLLSLTLCREAPQMDY